MPLNANFLSGIWNEYSLHFDRKTKEILMQSIQYHRYGGPEEMGLEEVEIPKPGRGQVRVRVRAAATNPADWGVRAGHLRLVSGSRFPRGLGHDFAGIVDAIGPEVTWLKVGDEVFGIKSIREAGAFAEYLVIAEKSAFRKPPSLSFELAAALPMASVTAWSAVVDRAKLRAGQSVFITGCLGAVGRAAVQIARMRGAGVAGNCSASGREEALALGVREVADYRAFDLAAHQHRFDLVFDTAGVLELGQCNSMLKPGGVAVHVVFRPGKLMACLLSQQHKLASGNPTSQRMAGITEAAEQGKLVPKIGRTVPLSEAIPALTELEMAGTPKGKLVIVFAPQTQSLAPATPSPSPGGISYE
jgi:NADPH:quinone reductase-like Zn-dependent oxidoreductase